MDKSANSKYLAKLLEKHATSTVEEFKDKKIKEKKKKKELEKRLDKINNNI